MTFSYLLKASLIFCATFFNSITYAASSPHAIVCDQAYALCTSAACLPDPVNPGKSICDCVVEQGKSAGFTTCEKRKPYIDQYQATHLISTFSFKQFSSKKSLACPKGAPWSNCVDMPCTQDLQNTHRAICICKLNSTQAFFTFAGSCKRNTCASGFWSGAIPGPASNALRDALNKGSKNSVAAKSCPTDSAN